LSNSQSQKKRNPLSEKKETGERLISQGIMLARIIEFINFRVEESEDCIFEGGEIL